jgi:DNA-binding beta-propeller fold protein YncE
MKKSKMILLILIPFIFILICSNCNSIKNVDFYNDTLTLKWKTEQIFKTPESVFYDTVRNLIYVSNINGNPSELDSNGFISKLSETGEVIELQWITGISAPKGMAVYGEKMYVSDVNYLIEIDLNTQKIIKKYFADGSEFLNDVEVDDKGKVYVSDISVNKIYVLDNDSLKIWIDSEELNHPNGLFYENTNLYVGSGNAILEINTENKKIIVLRNNTGSIDGLEAIGNGNFIISDWKGNINIIYSNDSSNLILSTENQNINAADIDFVIQKKMLFVPTFSDNRVMVYEITEKK